MAQKSFNLSNFINNNIHKPRVKDPETNRYRTLYTHVENAAEDSDASDKCDFTGEIAKRARKTYNSATNIRVLFITREHIYVRYYAAPVIREKNKESASWKMYSTNYESNTNSKGTELTKVVNKILNYDREYAQYQQQSSINNMGAVIGDTNNTRKAQEPDRYVVTGTFNILTNPFHINNIEELYFDLSLLASSDIYGFFENLTKQNSVSSGLQVMFNEANSKFQVLDDGNIGNPILNMFIQNNGVNQSNLRTKFPRLKEISLIANLEEFINGPQITSVGTEMLLDKSTWLDKKLSSLENVCKQNNVGNLIIRRKFPQEKEVNTDFIVRSETYLFDKHVLSKYVESIKERLSTEKLREKYDKAEYEQVEQTELEKRLLEIESKLGEEKCRAVVQLAINGSVLSKADWKNEFMQMTKENRYRFAKMAQIQI